MYIPSRVILHVGMTKAGSTLVQNFLESHYDELRAQGFLFPRSIFGRNDSHDPQRTSGHLELVRCLRRDDIHSFEEECRSAKAHTLILSAENIMNHKRIKGIDLLADLLRGSELHMIALLREQLDWLASRYYESVAKGFMRETRSFARFCAEMAREGALDYEANLNDLEQCFKPARVSVLDYNALTEENRVLSGFLDSFACPVRPSAEAERARVNMSFPCLEAIEVHRRLNCLTQDFPRDSQLSWSHAFREYVAAQIAEGALQLGKLSPPPPLATRLRKIAARSNRRLSNKFMDGRPFGSSTQPTQKGVPLDTEALDRLHTVGLQLLADEAQTGQASDRRALPGGFHAMTYDAREAAVLEEHAAKARAILHYGVGAGVFLCAGMHNKLIFCVERDREQAMRLQYQLDRADLPSSVVTWSRTMTNPVRYAMDIWETPFFRAPDMVVIDGDFRPACFAAVLTHATRPTTVIFNSWPEKNRALEKLVKPIQTIGRVAVFRITPGAAAAAQLMSQTNRFLTLQDATRQSI